MTEFIQGVAVIVLYRALTVICGLAIVYLGFVLFRIGVYEKAGELKAVWGTKNLTLKQAAPGTFFALFGAGVIAVTVWRGVDFSSVSSPASAELLASVLLAPGMPGLPISSANGALPDSVKSVLKSAAEGKQLSEPDRKTLSEWLEKGRQNENTIHYFANQPPAHVKR